MAAKETSLSLKDWIDKEGVLIIAKALRVNESGVRHWRRGLCIPSPKQMQRISELSRGAVDPNRICKDRFGKKSK